MHYSEANGRENAEFASCFLPPSSGEAKSYPCDPAFLLTGTEIANKHRNLFVSSEDFSVIDMDGVERLRSYLTHWDNVTIVAYYRHFFSYSSSLYNQRMKNNSIKRGTYKPIQDFFTLPLNTRKYVADVVGRFREKFDDVVVMNMHDKISPVESFFVTLFHSSRTHVRPPSIGPIGGRFSSQQEC